MILDDPTGNDYKPNCCTIFVHIRNPYSHAAYNLEGVDVNFDE